MINLVLDANILFSILIKSGKTEELFFNKSLFFYSPEFLLVEFFKYKEYILSKTQRNEKEFYRLLNILNRRIIKISNKDTINYLSKACIICPDPNDVEYFALALKLNCSIWSNDKNLKKQNNVKIYSTYDLTRMFP